MDSLLNSSRPPVFCPGCSHERVVQALDKTFRNMGLSGHQIVIVSDIGCSGLFDTFFNTHAFHGLHGRALTYAIGIKMARPDLHVVVTMGDGGLGIGGAHVLAASRRNVDLTLLVLNNFNYGMTGGQCSSTTPQESMVGSGFLNQLEKPVDICQVAGAAGAPNVFRQSAYDPDLPAHMERAIRFEGFALMDLWGVCPGRYTRRNKLTPKMIESSLAQLPPVGHYTAENKRPEYGRLYRETAQQLQPALKPLQIEPQFTAPQNRHQEVVILGSAGQRIVTAGELLCLAGMTAGFHSSQKNDYPITVLRGHSVSEMVLSKQEIDYTGIVKPSVVIALAQEGVNRKKAMFAGLEKETLVIKAKDVVLPACAGKVEEVDFKALKIKSADWALASLALLAVKNNVLSVEMLEAAVNLRFKSNVREQAIEVIHRVTG